LSWFGVDTLEKSRAQLGTACGWTWSSFLDLSNTTTRPQSTRSDVCTKYQEAAKIVNLALQGLVSQCVPGAKVIDVCEFGQTVITAQVSKLYTKKVNGRAIDRGVAFPVCISVNDIVCNHSPLPTDDSVSYIYLICVRRCYCACHGQPKCSTIACRCSVYADTVLPFRKGVP